jgi:hypothetical protein
LVSWPLFVASPFAAHHGVLIDLPRAYKWGRPTAFDAGACRMNTTLTLVDLGGAIALLIWGVHMVQTGITRAFGPQLVNTILMLSNYF